ncbi:MAG: hypothetical protein OXB92_00950 [Acidimicrobiaceae bacterium]|nr:hypothetical protein [Acidimicrobiaceae bacterium]
MNLDDEPRVPTFIGLDLAWKASNESGACWLEGETSAERNGSRLLHATPCL